MTSHFAARTALLLLALGFVAACKSPPPPPAPRPPARAALTINAAAGINPDATGRASPVVVHVYQLRAPVDLAGIDPFTLLEDDRTALGEALARGQEFLLQPGATLTQEMELDPAAREIAAIVAYRDIRNARWHAAAPLAVDAAGEPSGGGQVRIAVGASTVSVSIGP